MKKNRALVFGVVVSSIMLLSVVPHVQAATVYTPLSLGQQTALNFRQQSNLNHYFRFQNRTYHITNNEELLSLLQLMIQHLLDLKDGISNNQYSAIEIKTEPATAVDESRATLRGRVTDFTDSDYADVWFEYGDTLPRLYLKTGTQRIFDDEEDEIFELTVTALSPDTTYSFRVVGKDEDGIRDYGRTLTFRTNDIDSTSADEPTLKTNPALSITSRSATLSGRVDMQDYRNGEVFFVYGEDENLVDEIDEIYDRYTDIDESFDDLQKVLVATDFDTEDTFQRRVSDLDEDTRHYYKICVGYEDDDNEPVIKCGSTSSFSTDS